MSGARESFTRWIAGQPIANAQLRCDLEGAFIAGWTTAVRRERRAQRNTHRLLFERIKRLQDELDERQLASALGRSFKLHRAVEKQYTPANPFDVFDDASMEPKL